MTGSRLRTSDFDYHLPPEAIAQHPGERGESRLLVLGRTTGERRFAELPDLLDPGDLLVVNDTRVIPARLRARRPTGGRVEILLVEREESASWWCLLRPGRRLPPGGRPWRSRAALRPESRNARTDVSG